ncbi:hypothetical protein OOK36_21410 [Streptomyces sp. NBC_00365]|nr:hypothetical protein [Streptomyces sp. NBC_00365]MCX5091392.1 hypothetical protein [Streptomyces sp. NBC_00365]
MKSLLSSRPVLWFLFQDHETQDHGTQAREAQAREARVRRTPTPA